MKIKLKQLISPSIPLAVLLVVSCFLLWMSAYLGGRFATVPPVKSIAVCYLQSLLIPNTLLSNLLSLSFASLNAFLITQLNNKFTFIRTRTFLPIFIFLLLLGSWNETHIANGSHLALSLFILALFSIFGMYRNGRTVEQALMGSFLISLSSIIINPLIFLIPVCWIGFIILQSFSLRTFLASVFGAIIPWILYLSVVYYLHPTIQILDFAKQNVISGFDITTYALPNLIYASLLALIMIICLAGMFSSYSRDAIHTRSNLRFLVLILFAVTLLSIVFEQQSTSFLPFIALAFSFLAAHPFTLKQNNFFGILFFIFIALNIIFIISKYIIN
ncbi:MAG TPA: DUF6427 family protein [Paludibacter sp.]